MKILYIAGWGRSGSTILGNVLGELEGAIHTGEMSSIWSTGFMRNTPCGCGKLFLECEHWKKIVSHAFKPLNKEEAKVYFKVLKENTPQKLIFGRGEKNPEYSEKSLRLYNAIKTETKAKLIVDSSKSAGHLSVVRDTNDFYVIHLVRDPRAVAYSWKRKREHQLNKDETIAMKQLPAWKSALGWLATNLAVSKQKKKVTGYYLLKYEDFLSNPGKILEEITEFVQHKSKLPLVDEHTVNIGKHHTIWGNPARKLTGNVTLKLDDEWARKLGFFDKLVVTIITLPLLLKYKYKIFA